MEDRSLFLAYLAAWGLYVVGIHGYALWRRLPQEVVALSHAVPTFVAVSMAYIFLFRDGVTVAQFAAYSEPGMDLWSLWVQLWPLLLLATLAAAAAHIIWAIVVCWKREREAWIPVAALGVLICAFSFWTVLSNFPDA